MAAEVKIAGRVVRNEKRRKSRVSPVVSGGVLEEKHLLAEGSQAVEYREHPNESAGLAERKPGEEGLPEQRAVQHCAVDHETRHDDERPVEARQRLYDSVVVDEVFVPSVFQTIVGRIYSPCLHQSCLRS